MESVESPKTSQVHTMQQAPAEEAGDVLPDGSVVCFIPPKMNVSLEMVYHGLSM